MLRYRSQLKANLSHIPDNETSVKSWLKKHVWVIFTAILLISGIALSAISITYGVERQYVLSSGVSTTGSISNVYTKIEGSWTFRGNVPKLVDYKTVSFSDAKNDARHSFDARTKSGDVIGMQQSVTYLVENPSRATMTNEVRFQEMAYLITIPVFTIAVLFMIWLPKKLMS